MTESRFIKEFLELFERFSYRYSKWEVWNDFLYLAAVALANTVPGSEREKREKGYLETIKKYPKEYQELFPELLGIITLALDDNPEQDFLGSLYHKLHLEQEQKGQFFTPYHISHFMAEIQMVDRDIGEKAGKDYISVSDPACGAGAMLIAFANVARAHGINYQKHVLFVAQDIDRTAALMCYIQLSLLGCPAVVIVGDSLTKPGFHPDNQIWYTPFFYLNYWRFQSFFDEPGNADDNRLRADVMVDKEEMQHYVEDVSGQLMLALDIAS